MVKVLYYNQQQDNHHVFHGGVIMISLGGIFWILAIGGLFYYMLRNGGGCCGGHEHDVHGRHGEEAGHGAHGSHEQASMLESETANPKDPVCGMEVDTKETTLVSTHLDRAFRFCSERCRKLFDLNPNKYRSSGAH
jgi:YHS domain-containing protein